MKNSYSRSFLDKIITVKIDRPLGSKHPKYGWIYPINYGYIPGILAPDGEDLDAYVLGISEPIDIFSGRCIAIIHRINNDDDKLIVVPDKSKFTDNQIKKMTYFQEQYFHSEIFR